MVRFTKAALMFAASFVAVSAISAAAQDTTPSSGVFKTGQQIYDLCVSKDAADLEQCDYFIMAAHDMIIFYGDTKMAESKICLPAGTKVVDIRDVILARWRADPGALEYSAVSVIRNALNEKYGC